MHPAQLYCMRRPGERTFDLSSWLYVLGLMYLFAIARVVLCRRLSAKMTRCACSCGNVSTILCHVLFSCQPLAVANNDTTLLNDGPISGPSTLKGYLNKYTNVARGYSTRWFVLKDGVLSCMPLFYFVSRTMSVHTLKYRLSSPGRRTSGQSWFHLNEKCSFAPPKWWREVAVRSPFYPFARTYACAKMVYEG